MRRTLCIILLCLGCIVSSTIYAEEWILEKHITYDGYLIKNVYTQKPILTANKKGLIFKHKTEFYDGSFFISYDFADIEHGVYYPGYYQENKENDVKKCWVNKQNFNDYRDESILMLPGSKIENKVMATCESLGLKNIHNVSAARWRWIYSSPYVDYYICENRCYFYAEKGIIVVFVKEVGRNKKIDQTMPSIQYVNLNSHHVEKHYKDIYGIWHKDIKRPKDEAKDEAVYRAAERVYKTAVKKGKITPISLSNE